MIHNRKIGEACIIRTHVNLDEEIKKFKAFALASQFEPKKIEKVADEFKLELGYITYGLTENEELVWLAEKVDTSD